ncbi:hypothetical protein A6A06_01870 [Streptomyces sp. CB02923]|nr:hypothetical protein A6A06_01870 [Streptomyces sp. CB02923]
MDLEGQMLNGVMAERGGTGAVVVPSAEAAPGPAGRPADCPVEVPQGVTVPRTGRTSGLRGEG